MLLKSAKEKSVFKLNLPVSASIRHASGFTLVPRSALGILAIKLNMLVKGVKSACRIMAESPQKSFANSKLRITPRRVRV